MPFLAPFEFLGRMSYDLKYIISTLPRIILVLMMIFCSNVFEVIITFYPSLAAYFN